MRMNLSRASLCLLVACAQLSAFAARREKGAETAAHVIAAPEAAKAEMARCSLRAYENCDPTNVVQALLFTPRPVGKNPLPMVVYIPGNGEIGDISGPRSDPNGGVRVVEVRQAKLGMDY